MRSQFIIPNFSKAITITQRNNTIKYDRNSKTAELYQNSTFVKFVDQKTEAANIKLQKWTKIKGN